MAMVATQVDKQVEARALRSEGRSDAAIYRMVASSVCDLHQGDGVLVDLGCGAGQLWQYVGDRFTDYVGIDASRYDGFPVEGNFHHANLDGSRIPLTDEIADVVAAVETIEHLENPRALIREMVRLAKPDGLVLVTTPNQLSFLSLLTLVVKKRFSAFQDVHYPAHLTALLAIDLQRIADECGLREVQIKYSLQGRVVFTSWHYPLLVSRNFPAACSDNLMLLGKK